MTLTITENGSAVTAAAAGRLDSASAPEFTEKLDAALDGVTDLVIDLGGVDYISSAGLRALLVAQKRMAKQGTMTVRNIQPPVREILDITGIGGILSLK